MRASRWVPRWSNLSLRLKVFVVMSVPILALIASSISFLQAQRTENAAEDTAKHALLIRQAVQEAEDSLQAIDLSIWSEMFPTGAALGADTEAKFQTAIAGLRRLLADEPDMLGRIDEFQGLVARKISYSRAAMESIGSPDELMKLFTTLTPAQIAEYAEINEAPKRVLRGIAEHSDAEMSAAGSAVERARAHGTKIIVVAGAAGVVGGLLFMIVGFSGICRRIRRVRDNAVLLSEGRPLEKLPPSRDEVGQLAKELEEAAQLLSRREESLRAATEQAERANAAKSEFLSRMSHELRTPLNSILGFGQVLAQEDLTTANHEDVGHIVRAGRHLLTLIDEVLDLSRIEAGAFRTSIEPVFVCEVGSEVIDLTRPLAEERAITVKPCGGTIHWVQADRQRLKQVLLNLVANAIKFNRPGGTVMIRAVEDGEHVRIEVSDTGRGIPDEQTSRLFVPFERLDAAEHEIEGTGLGLALSRHLVEAMDGTIEVTSEVDVGSTFTVRLRRARPVVAEDDSPPVQVGAADATNAVVLYVEDNIANLHLIERVTAGRGIRLISAMKGTLGLDLAKLHRPDAILLDLHLPDMSGEKLLSQLKSDERTSAIPVIVISADATPASVARAMQAGADRYLTKPLDIQAFQEALDTMLAARSVA